MNASSVRMNITLPKDVVDALNKLTGPRERSRFITESVREGIEKRKKNELEQLLAEGYKVAAREGLAMSREFEHADLEGWEDEY